MLKVQDLESGYGRLQIINGVTIDANPNEVTVVLGPNGSGKSTLLKSIAGLTTIYKGNIEVDSVNLVGLSPHGVAKKGVAYLPQRGNVFPALTVKENLRLAAYTIKKKEYESGLKQVLELFPKLNSYFDSKVVNLSGGERQMVAIGMALLRKPVVVMFDEPTANLAPIISNQILKIVAGLAKEMKLTVVLVEQNARRALEIADKAYVLVSGKVTFRGTASELLQHEEIGRLYLGLQATK